jgi:hypothetical protein
LTIRAEMRWTGIGFGLGAMAAAVLLVWFTASPEFSETIGHLVPPAWSVPDPDPTLGALPPINPFHGEFGWIWPWPFWLLPVLGGVVGAWIGRTRSRNQTDYGAWADTIGEGRDAVQTALQATGPFAAGLRANAARALHRANTTRPPLSGSLKWVGLSLLALAVGASSHGWWAYTLPDPVERPPASFLDAMLGAAELIGDNSEAVSKWAGAVGLPEVAKAADTAKVAKELLGKAGISKDEALSVISDMEEKAKGIAGTDNAGKALEEMLKSKEIVDLGKEILGNMKGKPDSSESLASDVLAKLDPAKLAQLQSALEQGGFGPPGGEPDTPKGQGTTPSPTGSDGPLGGVMTGLQKLISESGLANRLFAGRINPDEARAALDTGRQIRREAATARARVLDGQSPSKPGTPSVPNDYGVLLKDLPVRPTLNRIPAEGSEPGFASDPNATPNPELGAAGTAAREPTIEATGRTFAAKSEDFRSQGHRLPRDVRTTAGRYFGAGN